MTSKTVFHIVYRDHLLKPTFISLSSGEEVDGHLNLCVDSEKLSVFLRNTCKAMGVVGMSESFEAPSHAAKDFM